MVSNQAQAPYPNTKNNKNISAVEFSSPERQRVAPKFKLEVHFWH